MSFIYIYDARRIEFKERTGNNTNNECSITFSFAPYLVIVFEQSTASDTRQAGFYLYAELSNCPTILYPGKLTTSGARTGWGHSGGSMYSTYGRKSADGKTIYWEPYSDKSFNESRLYIFMAIS